MRGLAVCMCVQQGGQRYQTEWFSFALAVAAWQRRLHKMAAANRQALGLDIVNRSGCFHAGRADESQRGQPCG